MYFDNGDSNAGNGTTIPIIYFEMYYSMTAHLYSMVIRDGANVEPCCIHVHIFCMFIIFTCAADERFSRGFQSLILNFYKILLRKLVKFIEFLVVVLSLVK